MGCNTSKEAMQAAAENASAAAEVKGQAVANIVQEGQSALNSAVENAKEVVTDSAKEVVENVKNTMDTVKDNVQETVNQTINSITGTVQETVANVTDSLKETVDSVKRNVSDIDPNDPEANRAATKIQAAFRGHQTRKNMKQGDAENKQNFKQEFSPDNKELCEAATKIQASFRGHLARKSAPKKDEEEELSKELEKLDAKAPDEEELDIDLSDPNLEAAATKIQASFRGHRVRKDKQPTANE